jgi:D-beta-D-heptose 7-phosphate kinase/D-beta-D-heptose 1-phosphate adenosyltransferase
MKLKDSTNVVVISGGFDPIHAGHVAMIKAARSLGQYLIVGVNSDAWLERKKGRAFMPWHHRASVIRAMLGVNDVLSFDDSDGSACDLLEKVKLQFPTSHIVFANGGDRTAQNIPEMSIKDVEFRFGIGGEDKLGSSSDFLREWKEPTTPRPWGEYRVLYQGGEMTRLTKVKELTVQPGQRLSMQRHRNRNELWFVVSGMCDVYSSMPSGYTLPPRTLGPHETVEIRATEWHQLTNPYTAPCRIVEIQFGSDCEESDIERR